MEIHRDFDNLPRLNRAVITTGTFDGLHKGHLKIIDQVKMTATELKGESAIVTFYPHPRLVLQGEDSASLQLLTTFDERMELLNKTGVDHVVVVPFTKEFSETLPTAYISEFLVKKLHVTCVITGYDHRFGKDRKGDFRLLEEYGKKFGYTVREIPEYVLKEAAISSTRIRTALENGDIKTANDCLGYDFFITGDVRKGHQLGRTLGFPTANIVVENRHKLIPKYGIYIAGVSETENGGDKIYPALVSIGIRPTINDHRETIEAYILDFSDDLYNKRLRIHFKQYIRPEVRFDSLDLLKEKMQEDERIARDFWGL